MVGPENLRMVDILAYYKMFRPLPDVDEFLEMLSSMDETFMKFIQEEQEKKDKLTKDNAVKNKGKRR